jgi:8-oxo-dGTP diphosphatase
MIYTSITYYRSMRQTPRLTVDGIALLSGQIVLIKRKNPPFRGMFALPGGFVEVGETVESAVIREFREETGLDAGIKRQMGVYSDPARDPRGHTASVVFELEITGGELRGGDDAAEARLFPMDKLPKLAFDHGKIIKDWLSRNE